MAYVPKIFKDRSVEFPFRRLLTPVSGMANTVDVSRVPGTIFEVGDEPDATNLNAEFDKIKVETDAINNSLTKLSASGVTLLNTAIAANTAYTLSESIHNYTEIYIEANQGGASKTSRKIPTDQLLLYTGLDAEHILPFTNTSYTRFKFTSATTIRINELYSYTNIKIVGYGKK